MVRVADYVIERIRQEGVNHIFMITGRGILYLSDAVARQEGMSGVSVHHEQAAAYAAMAYAQSSNNFGAALVSTGCASTNAITGTLCAWQDNVPCIFISGQNMLKETSRYTGIPVRTFGQQEADIISLVEPITKYATMISNPEEIVYEMEKAIYLAKSGRTGPVWIDIPLDIQNARIEPESLPKFTEYYEKAIATNDDIEYTVNIMKSARRPVILIGSGVRTADATELLKEYAEKYCIPVVYAASAVDIYGNENELSMGVVGMLGGTRLGNFTVQNADVVLVLGSRLSTMTIGNDVDKFAREAKIIVVDIDELEHSKNNLEIDRLILSDVKYFLGEISKCQIQGDYTEWIEKCYHWKTIFPRCEEKNRHTEKVDLYHLADAFSNSLGDDALFLCDAGLEELIMPAAIQFKYSQRCLHPVSQGAMGYALPAAIGAYYATKRPIVTVIGDGSIMMNLQELQTISMNHIPIKIFVINNDCYAVIRKRQHDLFRRRTIGTDMSNGVSCPNFSKVAQCFDIQYKQILNADKLYQQVQDVLNIQGTVLCEVSAEENQEYLASEHTRTKDNGFVLRPLEDQYPFMDRNIFLNEMIVQPIDQ